MRNLLSPVVVLLLLSVLVTAQLHAQNRQKALRYYQKLMEPVSESKRLTWLYLKEISRGKNMDATQAQRQAAISSLQATRKHVQKSKSYYDDASMRQEVLNFVDTSLHYLTNKCAALEALETEAAKSYAQMESYVRGKEKAFSGIMKATQQVIKKQNAFARQYKIGPTPSTGDKTYHKVAKQNEPMRYYNPIYLIYYKVHDQEKQVWKAMRKGDVDAMKAGNELLLNYANAALQQIETLKPYKDDNSLIVALKNIVRYYKQLATETYPSFVDYYEKKSAFQKIKKEIDALPEDQQSNEQIDAYNKAENAYNKVAKQFNYLNSSTRKTKKTRIDTWKLRVDNFFDFYLNEKK